MKSLCFVKVLICFSYLFRMKCAHPKYCFFYCFCNRDRMKSSRIEEKCLFWIKRKRKFEKSIGDETNQHNRNLNKSIWIIWHRQNNLQQMNLTSNVFRINVLFFFRLLIVQDNMRTFIFSHSEWYVLKRAWIWNAYLSLSGVSRSLTLGSTTIERSWWSAVS